MFCSHQAHHQKSIHPSSFPPLSCQRSPTCKNPLLSSTPPQYASRPAPLPFATPPALCRPLSFYFPSPAPTSPPLRPPRRHILLLSLSLTSNIPASFPLTSAKPKPHPLPRLHPPTPPNPPLRHPPPPSHTLNSRLPGRPLRRQNHRAAARFRRGIHARCGTRPKGGGVVGGVGGVVWGVTI